MSVHSLCWSLCSGSKLKIKIIKKTFIIINFLSLKIGYGGSVNSFHQPRSKYTPHGEFVSH